jgi:hypothetical protein
VVERDYKSSLYDDETKELLAEGLGWEQVSARFDLAEKVAKLPPETRDPIYKKHPWLPTYRTDPAVMAHMAALARGERG